jgi:hypothetical protein
MILRSQLMLVSLNNADNSFNRITYSMRGYIIQELNALKANTNTSKQLYIKQLLEERLKLISLFLLI